MKKLVSLALFAACLTAITVAPAQSIAPLKFNAVQGPPTLSAWSGSAYFDLRAKVFNAVVFNRIGELTIHGKPTGIEANGFVGAENSKGTPATFGIAAVWHKQLFDQVGFVFGIAGSLTGGRWGGGPVFGVAISF